MGARFSFLNKFTAEALLDFACNAIYILSCNPEVKI